MNLLKVMNVLGRSLYDSPCKIKPLNETTGITNLDGIAVVYLKSRKSIPLKATRF